MLQSMKRNTAFALIALIGVLALGLGGGAWAYKKIKQRRNQEFRFEGKMTVGPEFKIDAFKQTILADPVLDRVIEKNDLVSFWDLPDADKAKIRLREKFQAKVVGQSLKVTYQDKDQKMAKVILQDLINSYQEIAKSVLGAGGKSTKSP